MASCHIILTLLLIFSSEVHPAKILALIPCGTKSHTSGFEPLYHELVKRGHQVTIVTNHVPSKSIPNVRYIQNFNPEQVQTMLENPFEMRLSDKRLNLFDAHVTRVYELVCKSTYEKPEVMKLMEEDFDLVIVNSFLSECVYGLASEFKNSKVMFFSTLPLISFVSSVFGNPVTPSTTPLFVREFSDRMTFYERLQNFLQTVQYYYFRHYRHIPVMEATYRTFIPNAPSVAEFEKRIDLILINSHPIINYPRALLPNMIETSGLQLKAGGALPRDLQEFIDGSGDAGFIYFSFGSFIQGSELPENYRKAFLRAFGKLKQRVFWKFETDEEIQGLPPNVKLGKWFPQQDILAHPSIRLFITHGGLLSLQEAVYHGVPLLGIPLFGDQDGNLEQAFQRGFSLTLNVKDITEELIMGKITQILENESFKIKAREVSECFRDRPIAPLETAIYWTEYLLRHNKTSHLHSHGRHLHPIQYHSIDVITMLAVILFVSVFILVKIMKQSYQILVKLFTSFS